MQVGQRQVGVGRDAGLLRLGIGRPGDGHGPLQHEVGIHAAGHEPGGLVAPKDIRIPPGVVVVGALALLGEAAQNELPAVVGEPLAAQVEDQGAVIHHKAGHEGAVLPLAARQPTEKGGVPARAMRQADRIAGGEPAELFCCHIVGNQY